jgi:hypothetical protein
MSGAAMEVGGWLRNLGLDKRSRRGQRGRLGAVIGPREVGEPEDARSQPHLIRRALVKLAAKRIVSRDAVLLAPAPSSSSSIRRGTPLPKAAMPTAPSRYRKNQSGSLYSVALIHHSWVIARALKAPTRRTGLPVVRWEPGGPDVRQGSSPCERS